MCSCRSCRLVLPRSAPPPSPHRPTEGVKDRIQLSMPAPMSVSGKLSETEPGKGRGAGFLPSRKSTPV